MTEALKTYRVLNERVVNGDLIRHKVGAHITAGDLVRGTDLGALVLAGLIEEIPAPAKPRAQTKE